MAQPVTPTAHGDRGGRNGQHGCSIFAAQAVLARLFAYGLLPESVLGLRRVAVMSGLLAVLRRISTVQLRLDTVQRRFGPLLPCRVTTSSGTIAGVHEVGTVTRAAVPVPAGPIAVDLGIRSIPDRVLHLTRSPLNDPAGSCSDPEPGQRHLAGPPPRPARSHAAAPCPPPRPAQRCDDPSGRPQHPLRRRRHPDGRRRHPARPLADHARPRPVDAPATALAPIAAPGCRPHQHQSCRPRRPLRSTAQIRLPNGCAPNSTSSHGTAGSTSDSSRSGPEETAEEGSLGDGWWRGGVSRRLAAVTSPCGVDDELVLLAVMCLYRGASAGQGRAPPTRALAWGLSIRARPAAIARRGGQGRGRVGGAG